jgi:hypothetical protein
VEELLTRAVRVPRPIAELGAAEGWREGWREAGGREVEGWRKAGRAAEGWREAGREAGSGRLVESLGARLERLEAVEGAVEGLARAAVEALEARAAAMALQVSDAQQAARAAQAASQAQAQAARGCAPPGSAAEHPAERMMSERVMGERMMDERMMGERLAAVAVECASTRAELEALAEALRQHLLAQPALLQPLWAERQPLWRGIWTSGKLRGPVRALGAPTVPWEHERANTAPENYLFMQGRGALQVAAPGLYSVACAVFAHSGPTLSVCVNGAEVLRRVGSRKLAAQHREIGGFSICDFLSLPPNASIAVCLESNGSAVGGAQGFLELRKL